MPDDFSDVLAELAANDGAILYWQTDKARFEAAYQAGAIKRVSELYVHPDATTIEPGGCYTMPNKESGQ